MAVEKRRHCYKQTRESQNHKHDVPSASHIPCRVGRFESSVYQLPVSARAPRQKTIETAVGIYG